MIILQNSLSNMTTNCANCDYSAINGSKVIHNVEGVKINFTRLFYLNAGMHRKVPKYTDIDKIRRNIHS